MLGKRRTPKEPWKGFIVNHTVGLEVPEGPFAGQYTTRICDLEAGQVALATPTRQGELITLRPDSLVLVLHGRPGGVYRVPARVARVEETPLALVWLKNPGRAERTQRRDFVRLPLALPLTYAVKAGEGPARRPAVTQPVGQKSQVVSLPPLRRRGRTLDLSAGGARLLLPEVLAAGTELDLEIMLGARGPLRTRAEVVRVLRESGGARGREAETAVRFVNLSEVETDRVVGFLFAEEPKLRRRGLF